MPDTLMTWNNSAGLQPRKDPHNAILEAGKFAASLTLAQGTVLGKRTSDGALMAYSDAGTVGETVAVGILKHAIHTDASGKVFFGGSTTASRDNPPFNDAPYYIAGVFDPDEITGEDAGALVDLKARTTPEGYILIPG